MARYIDADELEQEIERTIADSGCVNHESEIMDCIRYAPDALVKEVVHGEWKNNASGYPECSKCGYLPMFDPHIDDIYYSPFCPNCGADMRGVE